MKTAVVKHSILLVALLLAGCAGTPYCAGSYGSTTPVCTGDYSRVGQAVQHALQIQADSKMQIYQIQQQQVQPRTMTCQTYNRYGGLQTECK